jgi:alpha-L-rhamnosidase
VLNDVWDLCKYSIKATSFMGVYIDGDRERIPYEGDAYINQLCHYGVDREFTLARYSTEYLMHHPTWPADWQLHMPLMAWADYLYTGNAELLARYYDDLAAKTLVALAREDGLIVEDKSKMTPEFKKSIRLNQDVRILVDWPPASFTKDSKYGERDGYDMRPVNTVANAFHYRTIVLMADIARVLGKADEARRWSERAEKVSRTFNEVFFDHQHGRYIDGEGSTHSALHANMFPLAFGLVPAEHVAGVVEFIQSRGMACSVYGAQYLMDALYHAGAEDYALSLLTATHDRSWAHMLYTVGSTITTEAWDNKYKENQDWNHAWGAVPANAIPRLLMGIEPLEPGFARMRIRPQTASLAEARITTPTIRGPVKVNVSRPDDRTWRASLTIPANTMAELHVPATDPAQVTEGGRAASGASHVKFLRVDNGRAVFEVPGGSYEFETRR